MEKALNVAKRERAQLALDEETKAEQWQAQQDTLYKHNFNGVIQAMAATNTAAVEIAKAWMEFSQHLITENNRLAEEQQLLQLRLTEATQIINSISTRRLSPQEAVDLVDEYLLPQRLVSL